MEKKTIIVHFRVNPSDYEFMTYLANQENLCLSAFLRNQILKIPLRGHTDRDLDTKLKNSDWKTVV